MFGLLCPSYAFLDGGSGADDCGTCGRENISLKKGEAMESIALTTQNSTPSEDLRITLAAQSDRDRSLKGYDAALVALV